MTNFEIRKNKKLVKEAIRTGKIAMKNGDSIMERRFNALYRAIDKYLLSEEEEKELETLYNSLWDDSYDEEEILLKLAPEMGVTEELYDTIEKVL